MQDILTEADLCVGAVYCHFRSKDEIGRRDRRRHARRGPAGPRVGAGLRSPAIHRRVHEIHANPARLLAPLVEAEQQRGSLSREAPADAVARLLPACFQAGRSSAPSWRTSTRTGSPSRSRRRWPA
jgi:AcrR family transcriptional regulator